MRIAIVGMGPRGLSVLERLVARAAEHPRQRLTIEAIDDVEVGAGRIWRTDQPPWFTMNTVAGQVTIYSGGPDDGPPRAGAGPSLHQWLGEQPQAELRALGENGYAPRAAYGRYLRAAYEAIVACRPARVAIRTRRARVVALAPCGAAYRLELDDGSVLEADRVVLTTGHPKNEPDPRERELAAFAAARPGLRYVAGDSAADLPLDALAPGSTVAIQGLGLGFYDVMLGLTLGRGGRFARDRSGALRYLPSGREPRLVAGSRSGLPILARGRNEKPPQHVHRAVFFTPAAVAAARARSRDGRLNFAVDVFPLIRAELEHVFYAAHARGRHGGRAAEHFARAHAAAHTVSARAAVLQAHELADIPAPDLGALARPFAHARFADRDAFRAALLNRLRADVDDAAGGNVGNPLKAALDVLRDVRNTVRLAVDFGGLTRTSYRRDFLGWYVPVNALLSAGPPAERVAQAIALIESGVLDVVGPDASFACDRERGCFTIASPQVAGSARTARTLVDARIPAPALARDGSPLTRHLLRAGTIADYEETGGLAVTDAPFHVVDAAGRVQLGLFALGIPTEHARWFTQVGSGRPGMVTGFSRDADAIALALLAAAAGATLPATASA